MGREGNKETMKLSSHSRMKLNKRVTLTLKRYDRFFPKLPLRVTQQKGNKDIKSLNAHNSVTIGPTELADPSLESSFHALSDGQCVVSG